MADATEHTIIRDRLLLLYALAGREGWWCHYCRQPLIRPDYPPHEQDIGAVEAHVDHVVPRAHGGSDAFGNRVLACGDCNRRKGTRSYAEFVALIDA